MDNFKRGLENTKGIVWLVLFGGILKNSMGWGQPVAGKRVHSSTHEDAGGAEFKTGESEEMSEPPPYCSKRAREISPDVEAICNGSDTETAVENGGQQTDSSTNSSNGERRLETVSLN